MHRLAYNEMIQKQSDISARLADINQHFAERIKVEIPIPSGDQIAWWGSVMRLEEYQGRSWGFQKDPFETPKLVVGVRFAAQDATQV